MVVVVIRITASPARGLGFGTSSTALRSLPLNTTAFIVFIWHASFRERARQAAGRKCRRVSYTWVRGGGDKTGSGNGHTNEERLQFAPKEADLQATTRAVVPRPRIIPQ